jgi:hypothetical protein
MCPLRCPPLRAASLIESRYASKTHRDYPFEISASGCLRDKLGQNLWTFQGRSV